MKVYRVEHKITGKGPYYRSSENPRSLNDELDSHSMFSKPTPVLDEGLKSYWVNLTRDQHDTFLFGFLDLQQFNEWFCVESERSALRTAGYVLRVYEISEIVVGHSQVVFKTYSYSPIRTYVEEFEIPEIETVPSDSNIFVGLNYL